jgi:hypothetical protein
VDSRDFRILASISDKVNDWRVMPLVLAINYGEYDPKKYLELLERAYMTITEGLVPILETKRTKRRFNQLELSL